jgi:hypothetical protein
VISRRALSQSGVAITSSQLGARSGGMSSQLEWMRKPSNFEVRSADLTAGRLTSFCELMTLDSKIEGEVTIKLKKFPGAS